MYVGKLQARGEDIKWAKDMGSKKYAGSGRVVKTSNGRVVWTLQNMYLEQACGEGIQSASIKSGIQYVCRRALGIWQGCPMGQQCKQHTICMQENFRHVLRASNGLVVLTAYNRYVGEPGACGGDVQ